MSDLNMDKWDEIYEEKEAGDVEVSQERKEFVIDDSTKAEWAVNAIKKDRDAAAEYIETCENMIKMYKDKINLATLKLENKTSYLEYLLAQYFETVEKKKTKAQETFALPSGKLVRKFGTNEFNRDEEKFVKWLKDNQYTSFVETKESAKWGEFKKVCDVSGDMLVDKDGQIVEGVTITKKADEFKVVLEKE